MFFESRHIQYPPGAAYSFAWSQADLRTRLMPAAVARSDVPQTKDHCWDDNNDWSDDEEGENSSWMMNFCRQSSPASVCTWSPFSAVWDSCARHGCKLGPREQTDWSQILNDDQIVPRFHLDTCLIWRTELIWRIHRGSSLLTSNVYKLKFYLCLHHNYFALWFTPEFVLIHIWAFFHFV